MKRSWGFTLIEILASVFVVAILSPLVAVVFYQVMVTPPEQSARLTLTNEVGLVASQLYADVYMSENFSYGTYPYFGNFSWSDNASNTNYLVSYSFDSSRNAIVRQTRINGSVTPNSSLYLSHHISSANFSLVERPDNIEVIITANATTTMGKPVSHTVTLYIAPRPILAGIGRGGIWGADAVLGTGSLTIPLSGTTNMFNGDIKIDGAVSVTGANNRVTGTITCDSISNVSTFTYKTPAIIPCTLTLPNIGIPQDYFGTNLSAGIQVLDDVNHEYVFNGSVSLTNVSQVWQSRYEGYGQVNTLKPGYYYSPGTITLSDHSTRGSVTFIAKKIVIENNTTSQWDENRYIGIQFYDKNGLLLWATGNSSNDIEIRQVAAAWWNPCVNIQGVLYAPNGEIELSGSGSAVVQYSKAMLSKGAIMAKDLTISGHDWWIYRW